MQKIVLLAAICAGSIVVSTGVAAAHATIKPGLTSVTDCSAAKKKKTSKHTNASAQRSYGAIGCGYNGCGPVPRGCTVTAGMDWYGNYSGQDEVICGRR